jgi:hypothetical protein
MKEIFWNSRGLSDLAKFRFLSDTSKDEKLDFVALLETGKKDFSQSTLNNICAGQDFMWHWSEPHGRSRGILLGVNLETFDTRSIDEGDFYVKFHLRNKNDGFRWVLVAVYGAAQGEHEETFLAELVQTCAKENLPLLVGGDFNIIRNPQEKNNDRYNDRWPFLFNAVIDSLDLRELDLSNRKFTWANSRPIPTFETLDRILVTTEWEAKFPLATVRALNREISDHTLLLMSTGNGTHSNKQPLFKFELGWFLRDGFSEMVAQVWKEESRGQNTITEMAIQDSKTSSISKRLGEKY